MKHFRLVHSGLDVSPIVAELDAQPLLFGQHKERTAAPDSPHRASSDVWIRARSYDDIGMPGAFRMEHRPCFYPAWRALPSIQPVVFSLMGAARGVELGNILITKLPAGERILPHIDTGWAPEFYQSKFYVILKANEQCLNRCGGESVVMRAGEIFQFENRVSHSIENNGETERVALIVTLRSED